MKKFFLLSVLFIFMGNALAKTYVSKSEMIEVIETSYGITVACVADHVFIGRNIKDTDFWINSPLTQVMVSAHQGRLASSNKDAKTRPMLCREYKNQMEKNKKRQG